MDKHVEKAFDFASDATKQLLTLSTGILGLTITFSKDLLNGAAEGPRRMMMAAWCIYILSLALGSWTLLALTGSLAAYKPEAPGVYGSNVRIPAILQIATFLLATLIVVVAGIWAVNVRPVP